MYGFPETIPLQWNLVNTVTNGPWKFDPIRELKHDVTSNGKKETLAVCLQLSAQ